MWADMKARVASQGALENYLLLLHYFRLSQLVEVSRVPENYGTFPVPSGELLNH